VLVIERRNRADGVNANLFRRLGQFDGAPGVNAADMRQQDLALEAVGGLPRQLEDRNPLFRRHERPGTVGAGQEEAVDPFTKNPVHVPACFCRVYLPGGVENGDVRYERALDRHDSSF